MITKKDLDKFVTDEWDYIDQRAKEWIKGSRLICDMDIINYAYEQSLKSINNDKIETHKELRSYYFQFLRTSTIWRNCKYHRDSKHQTGGRWQTQLPEDYDETSSDHRPIGYKKSLDHLTDSSYEKFGENLDLDYTYENIYEDKDLLNKLDFMFEDSNPTRDECLIYEAMKKGYYTSGKFSEYTKIPRTTSWLLLKKMKSKLNVFLDELKHKYKHSHSHKRR